MTMRGFIPFFCLSLAMHAGIFAAYGVLKPAQALVAGVPDGDVDRVFVSVVADRDLTPVATTPAPEDSLASAECEKQNEPAKVEERPEVLVKEEPIAPMEINDKPVQEEKDPKHEVLRQEKQPDKKQDESVASTPQVASSAYMRRASWGNEMRDFQTLLLAAIRQATYFPKEALKERRHGEVVVAFTISRDGTLSAVRIVTPSGCIHLDNAATEIITKAAAKFPPFPSFVDRESLNYTVPILFKEKRGLTATHSAAGP